jgi:hypothetical protein
MFRHGRCAGFATGTTVTIGGDRWSGADNRVIVMCAAGRMYPRAFGRYDRLR